MGSKRLERLPDAFLELHIEQGPVLALAGEPLGVVTAIAGAARGAKVFVGRADHAGTTPMDARADALVDAARFILHVRECAKDGLSRPSARSRSSRMRSMSCPSASPSVSTLGRRTRSQLDALVEAIGFEPKHRLEPAHLSDAFDSVLPDAPRLVSGAGHDAMVLALAGVPSSMLFVRSLNGGVSHHPDELSSDEDIALAVDALTAALSRLVS